jgi:hypothetical protein
MRSLLLTMTLSLGLVACSHNSKHPTVPTAGYPVPHGAVTAQAMKDYFGARFAANVTDGSLVLDFADGDGVAPDVIKELDVLGIHDMSGVAALVPADFETKGFMVIREKGGGSSNLAGLMRDLMILHDPRGYIEKAWNHTWVCSGAEDFPVPIAYGLDYSILESENMCSEEGGEDGGGDMCDGDGDGDDGDDDPCGDPCE